MPQLFLFFWQRSEDVSAISFFWQNSGNVSIVSIYFEESRGCLCCFYISGGILGMSQLVLCFWWNPGDDSAGSKELLESPYKGPL